VRAGPGGADAVRRFVGAINARDPDAILALMSPRPTFVDSLGASIRGRRKMRAAWAAYFAMVPDYRVRVRERLIRGARVALLGWAEGTYAPEGRRRPERRWRTPAAWLAVVDRAGRVREWRVYADNEPLRRIAAAVARGRVRGRRRPG
jgi:uncharacterized protein (TIGR02246 family)